MNNQQNKNRLLIVVIFAMSFIPFLIAWYYKEHPTMLKTERTNYGDLIIPPINTDLLDLNGIDQFSTNNISELAGHWVIVNIIPENDCQKLCLDALHKAKQIVLMLNKDLTRMRRVALFFNDVPLESASAWGSEDPRLLKVKPNDPLKNKLKALSNGTLPEGSLLMMDPLGNLMMRYAPGFDPYKVRDDLKKLLMVSQIG